MPNAYNVLILGASYGSLLATKLALAGHNTKLVCLPAEAEAINRDGAVVRLPVKGRGQVEIRSKGLPGQVSADGSRKKSNGLMTDMSATRSTVTSNRSVFSGNTRRAR